MNREVSDDLLGRFSGCVAPTPGRVLGGLPYAHSGIPYIVVSSAPKIGTQSGRSKFEKGCATREGLLFLETEKDAKI